MAERRTRKTRDPAWIPPDWKLADATALQALQRGEATAEQQRRALDWIITGAAGTYDLSFRSDADGGERDTAFAEGRRFVGLQVVKLLNLPRQVMDAMRSKDG